VEGFTLPEQLAEFLYLIAIILFAVGIKRLGKVRTSRAGNGMAALAMFVAILVTMIQLVGVDWKFVIGGVLAGAVVGAFAARKVPMTDMPEMVALFNGSGGAASVLVVLAVLVPALFPDGVWGASLAMHEIPLGLEKAMGADIAVSLLLSIIIGGVTLTGSVVAYAKLAGKISGNAIVFPGQHALNALLILGTVGLSGAMAFGIRGHEHAIWIAPAVTALSLLLGVLLVIPIGGADMPVVISLLNSYSGIAASMTGFVLQSPVLIVSGAMVGAAGLILTNIMCKAMNRSLTSVLLGGFGATTSAPDLKGAQDYDNVKSIGAEELAMMLDGVGSVIIVPGYGLAVAQAQHAVRDLADYLEAHGCGVRYAIHPVAGRMPGHMNVLLAESNVPYEQLIEMDDINADFKSTDVAIVLGANDVVNPAALDEPDSPLAGMPILMVHEANNVVVVKRSLAPGYAGVKNKLFERDNTVMLFADAKGALEETLKELKEAAA